MRCWDHSWGWMMTRDFPIRLAEASEAGVDAQLVIALLARAQDWWIPRWGLAATRSGRALRSGATDPPRWRRPVDFYVHYGFKKIGPRLCYRL